MPPLLEVDRVSKSFGGVAANVDISFDVADGEILGLIGPNGAGKTSLFNAISGEVVPDAGAIRLAGRVISGSTRTMCAAGCCADLSGGAQLRFHDGAGERHGRRLCPVVAHACGNGTCIGDA